MTPNKLPPLPEPFSVCRDEETPAYSDDQMNAYAAEALRQSQSLPAGAVAGLPEDRKILVYRLEQMAQTPLNYESSLVREAIEALQADAREKGEDAERYNWLKCGGWEVMQDPRMWPAGLRFDAAIDAGMAMAAAGGHATQPAQASEAATGKLNGYLFRERAIEVIMDGVIPIWMSETPGLRVTITPLATSSQETASE